MSTNINKYHEHNLQLQTVCPFPAQTPAYCVQISQQNSTFYSPNAYWSYFLCSSSIQKKKPTIKQSILFLQTLSKPVIQLGGRPCVIFCWVWYFLGTGKANKYVSEWNIQQGSGRQEFVWHISCWERIEIRRCSIAIALQHCFCVCY